MFRHNLGPLFVGNSHVAAAPGRVSTLGDNLCKVEDAANF